MQARLKVKGRRNGTITGRKEDAAVCVRIWVRAHLRGKSVMKCSHQRGALPDPQLSQRSWVTGPLLKGTLPFLSLCRGFSPSASALKPFSAFKWRVKMAWAEQLSCTSHPCSDLTCVFPLPSSLAGTSLDREETQEKYSETEDFSPVVSLLGGTATDDSGWGASSWLFQNSGEWNKNKTIHWDVAISGVCVHSKEPHRVDIIS